MTLKSRLPDDVKLLFINTGEFGESVTYTPSGGAPKVINAVVIRERLEPDGPDRGMSLSRGCEVYIANDTAAGISTVNKNNDKVSFPVESGGTAVSWVVVEVLSHDEGIWHLRVVKG